VRAAVLNVQYQAQSQSRLLSPIFFWSLALATLIPVIWLGFGVEFLHQNESEIMAALMPIIAITGIGHVGATAYFYTDNDFFELIRQNKRRFFILPILAAGGCLAVFLTSALAWTLLLTGFLAWQLYHYQRQNYGLIAFAAQNAGLGRLPAELNRMLNFGVAGAVCNLIRRNDLKGAFASAAAYDLGVALFVVSTVLLIKLLVTTPQLRAALPVVIFTVSGWAFFLPSLVSTNELVGFWSYAIAHGAQYCIFMIVVSGNCKRGIVGLSIFVLIFAAMLVTFEHLNGSGAGLAAYTGIVMSHFLIDAKIWRLREPLQHHLIQERFNFIFS